MNSFPFLGGWPSAARVSFPSVFLVFASLCVALAVMGCGDDDLSRPDVSFDAGPRPDMGFRCLTTESERCEGNEHLTCTPDGEFLRAEREDCASHEPAEICVASLGCVLCRPATRSCRGDDVVLCNDVGDSFELEETCERDEGFICRGGQCVNLCQAAVEDRSYQGCEFYGADLDNAALGRGRDASSQQYAIVVSNPSNQVTEVWVEQNDALVGEEPLVTEVMRVQLLPGDLEIFELPRREVDGSSSNQDCSPPDDSCPGTEVCVCGGDMPPCFCRVSLTATGQNDGTHSAFTSQAYRVRSSLPIIAYQFNPLDNSGVFSNDASLLLPTSAIGTHYTVVSWPQTIADADCDPMEASCRDIDFDTGRDDEDLRAFLTVMGTVPNTLLRVELGPRSGRVWRPGTEELMGAGDIFEVTMGEFDVLNLETDGLNNDFTGTLVEGSDPVAVFVGSEASDAPRFETYATRQCCADHLEDQLFSNDTLGSSFMIARMPARSVSLNNAFLDPIRDSVAEVNEPEWVRVQAVSFGETIITTTLPPPDDRFSLSEGQSIILRADQDFLMTALDSRPLAVLQIMASQQVIGIPSRYPGGDPAIVAVPPREQYRRDYVFLTPNQYAFDYVIITAPAGADIRLDGEALNPRECETSPADGIVRGVGDPPPREVIHRCQLAFPDIGDCDPDVEGCVGGVMAGEQRDGVHTIVATEPVGVVVYGFDAFVSYAYAAGLNLLSIPR